MFGDLYLHEEKGSSIFMEQVQAISDSSKKALMKMIQGNAFKDRNIEYNSVAYKKLSVNDLVN